ncbi:MAG TPA: tetratricopeptide repeat protein [Holophaga sp.]|jgi:TolA-binding protein|nr:tetratricopeptide repeat protein [Holophaga sp.]
MHLRHMIAPLAIPALALGIGCGSEEQLKRVEQEVGDLKLEVFKLRQQVEESNKLADSDRTASTEARTMDRRFQADLQETLRQLQDSTRVLNSRLGEASRRPSPRGAASETPAAAQPQPGGDDEKALNAILLDYNRGNYSLAAESLDLFLKSNPGSAKRSDALFYLGLSNWNQKLYDKAQVSFEAILKDHPNSNQFLPAKLKRGQCLLRRGLKPAAVKTFKEIVDSFPGTSEARISQQELADLGL